MAINSGSQITIIGSGVVGLSCAIQLQKRGMKVAIIDGNPQPDNCSMGNAGHFAIEQVNPLANWAILPRIPKMLLNPTGPLAISPRYFLLLFPWFVQFLWNARARKVAQSRQALSALNSVSIESWKELLGELNAPQLINEKGHLLVFENAAKGHQVFNAQKELVNFGVTTQRMSAQQVQELEPQVSAAVEFGIYYPNTAFSYSPSKIIECLHQTFLTNGGDYLCDRITHLHCHGESLELKGRSTYSAQNVLIAAGAWSHRLTKQLGYSVPLETERGYHLMVPQYNNLLTRPVASFERSFIMTPMEQGLRLAGTVELAGVDAAPNYYRADCLLEHAKQITRMSREAQGGERWMGCRPSLPDSLPVIGAAPRHRNVFFAFGHQHLGLTQGAITGKLIAQCVSGENTMIDLDAYRIDRFNER